MATKKPVEDVNDVQEVLKDPDVAKKDSAVEKTEEGLVGTIEGVKIRLQDTIGSMALMEWAASGDETIGSVAGLRAVYHVLEDLVHPDDWVLFRSTTRKAKTDAEKLFDFVNDAMEKISALPTKQRDDS